MKLIFKNVTVCMLKPEYFFLLFEPNVFPCHVFLDQMNIDLSYLCYQWSSFPAHVESIKFNLGTLSTSVNPSEMLMSLDFHWHQSLNVAGRDIYHSLLAIISFVNIIYQRHIQSLKCLKVQAWGSAH